MKSIMQYGKYCWLCGRNGSCDPLDKHHVFGGALRDKSERYGLTVYLCHHDCHIFGEGAVHKSGEARRKLQAAAQRAAMEKYGWTTAEFMLEFGRNYIGKEEKAKAGPGRFRVLDDELCVSW